METKMTVNEVADALGVTERTIQRHLKDMRAEGLSDNVVVRGSFWETLPVGSVVKAYRRERGK
jgi:predicted ArsR family transcriptional regulator